MNRFFQAPLSRFLREYLASYHILGEYPLNTMMRYVPGYNRGHRKDSMPRPDLAIVYEHRMVALLDAKYRDLWAHDLPRNMLYQLALYALSQPAGGTATILYPTLDGTAEEARLQIHDPRSGQPTAWVVLRPVNLESLDPLVSGRDHNPRPPAAFARQLVFGATEPDLGGLHQART